jgi:hypothetical protein
MSFLAIWRLAKPILPHVMIGLAPLAAMWWLDHQGYQRAKRDAEYRQVVDAISAERKTRRIEHALGDAVAGLATRVGSRIDAIDAEKLSTLQSMLKDFRDDPRYSDPACFVTDGVWGALDTAVTATDPARAAGSVTIPLPAPGDAR